MVTFSSALSFARLKQYAIKMFDFRGFPQIECHIFWGLKNLVVREIGSYTPPCVASFGDHFYGKFSPFLRVLSWNCDSSLGPRFYASFSVGVIIFMISHKTKTVIILTSFTFHAANFSVCSLFAPPICIFAWVILCRNILLIYIFQLQCGGQPKKKDWNFSIW